MGVFFFVFSPGGRSFFAFRLLINSIAYKFWPRTFATSICLCTMCAETESSVIFLLFVFVSVSPSAILLHNDFHSPNQSHSVLLSICFERVPYISFYIWNGNGIRLYVLCLHMTYGFFTFVSFGVLLLWISSPSVAQMTATI